MRNDVDDLDELPEQLRALAVMADTTRLREVAAGARVLGQRRLRQRRALGVMAGVLAIGLVVPVATEIRSRETSTQTTQIAGAMWGAAATTSRGDLAGRSDLSSAAQQAWNADKGTHTDMRVVFAGTMPAGTGRVVVLTGLDRLGQPRVGVVGDGVVPSAGSATSMAVLHDLPAPASAATALAVTIVGAQPAKQLDQPVLTVLTIAGPDAVSARWSAADGTGPLNRVADGAFAVVLPAPQALGARVTVQSVEGMVQQITPEAPDGALEVPATS